MGGEYPQSYVRLDKNNAAVLMVDHQVGLLSLVRDIDPDKFKNNVLAVADLADYFKLPTILTTSFVFFLGKEPFRATMVLCYSALQGRARRLK
jgi:hypothetical protein